MPSVTETSSQNIGYSKTVQSTQGMRGDRNGFDECENNENHQNPALIPSS